MNTVLNQKHSPIKKLLVLKSIKCFVILSIVILIAGCVKQFMPAISSDQDLLVVEGMITDQPGQNTIKLSTSMPLGLRSVARPLSGCNVSISDDQGNSYTLTEADSGSYSADPGFQGIVGRSYSLHIQTNQSRHNLTYESLPVLLRPVPAIDSVYYDRVVISRASDGFPNGEGCSIYLDTHDPDKICKFFRWEYIETWEMRLPYNTDYNHCWVTSHSGDINIKNTSSFSEDRIEKLSINFVSNATDRLKLRYSILVNQYSMGEEEYAYWDKLQNIVQHVGTLYDIVPASTFSNLKCNENPAENVLGYFSVSSVKSSRIFIQDQFRGMPDLYTDCVHKSVGYLDPIPELNINIWIIVDHPQPPPGYKLLTYDRGCADCRVRGTEIRPSFW